MIIQKLPGVVVDDLLEFCFHIIDHCIYISLVRLQRELFDFINTISVHFSPVRSVRAGMQIRDGLIGCLESREVGNDLLPGKQRIPRISINEFEKGKAFIHPLFK